MTNGDSSFTIFVGCITTNLCIAERRTHHARTVSYTHLDVYKRQARWCMPIRTIIISFGMARGIAGCSCPAGRSGGWRNGLGCKRGGRCNWQTTRRSIGRWRQHRNWSAATASVTGNFTPAAVSYTHLVKCENTYAGELSLNEEGKLQTTKADRDRHGFGPVSYTHLCPPEDCPVFLFRGP